MEIDVTPGPLPSLVITLEVEEEPEAVDTGPSSADAYGGAHRVDLHGQGKSLIHLSQVNGVCN